jgi:hypothetical protein
LQDGRHLEAPVISIKILMNTSTKSLASHSKQRPNEQESRRLRVWTVFSGPQLLSYFISFTLIHTLSLTIELYGLYPLKYLTVTISVFGGCMWRFADTLQIKQV